jgi:hypothetical protein
MKRKEVFVATRWPDLRNRSRTRFLLVDSILAQGVAFGLIMSFVGSDGRSPGEVLVRFLFMSLFFGYFVGCLTWWLSRRSYAAKQEDLGSVALQTNRVFSRVELR